MGKTLLIILAGALIWTSQCIVQQCTGHWSAQATGPNCTSHYPMNCLIIH